MSKPIKLEKGDIVRGKASGIKYTVIGIMNANSFRVVKDYSGNTGILIRSDVRFVSRPGAATKTAEVAIDVNTASIESMEKALKAIDAQRDIIADKLIAKKKEAREETEQQKISNILKSIKSQSPYLGLRVHGNLARKGVFLSGSYNWNIVTDCDGALVLVPTLKK